LRYGSAKNSRYFAAGIINVGFNPDWLRTLFAKGPEDQVHSGISQLPISSFRGLGSIDVTGIMAALQYWHFLRWFVIRRLMRKPWASARRSYFSRSSFTIALNFGQVARNIVELPGWIGIEKFLPTDANRGEVFGGRVLNACAYIYAFDAREFAGRGLV
jgi:hypothetical protein